MPTVIRRGAAVLGLLLVLAGCSFGGQDRVLVEGQNWHLAVVDGAQLRFRDGDAISSGSRSPASPTVDDASTFVTKDQGTTLFAGAVSDDAATVTVTTQDGADSQTELVVSHDVTWFWVQLPGKHDAVGIVARNEAGAVIDEYKPLFVPGAPGEPLVEPQPL